MLSKKDLHAGESLSRNTRSSKTETRNSERNRKSESPKITKGISGTGLDHFPPP